MEEYNLTISESIVFKIADEVIRYLNEYPEDYVDCLIMKVILDRESKLSWEFIINTASKLSFPLLFNGEEVDQFGFLRGMFEIRDKLADRVEKRVKQEMGEYNGPPNNWNKFDRFRRLIVDIARILPYLSDFFNLSNEP